MCGAVFVTCISVFLFIRFCSYSVPLRLRVFIHSALRTLLPFNPCNRLSLCENRKIMVAEILKVITQYEEWLCRTQFAPRFSYGRPILAEDAGANRM